MKIAQPRSGSTDPQPDAKDRHYVSSAPGRMSAVRAGSPSQRQTCKVCGRPDKFDFNISDDVWRAVVPSEFQSLVVCLFCFDDFAHRRNVAYAKSLRSLWFAGDKATFRFAVQRRME